LTFFRLNFFTSAAVSSTSSPAAPIDQPSSAR